LTRTSTGDCEVFSDVEPLMPRVKQALHNIQAGELRVVEN